jgi:DNA invertase Pin-like site-specific DNA recombinase
MADIRAVLYARMSSEDQETSIEQQLGWAKEACPKQGISIEREFLDHAKKGHETEKRTAFHEMLRFCQEQAREKRPIEAIVCWNPNRFSRSDSQETSWFLWEFRKVGVQRMFTASNGWIDFRRMEDRVLYGIVQDTSSHRYVQELARDAIRGKKEAAEAGRWNGGPIPYGYRIQYHEVVIGTRRKRKPEKFVVFEPEAEIVRWLFRTYADTDAGLRGLAAELNRRNVPSPNRSPCWGMSTIKRMFNNPVYLGEVTWNRNAVGKFFGIFNCRVEPVSQPNKLRKHEPEQWIRRPDRHEAIIDRETFDRTQQKLINNRGHTSTKRGVPYVLSGLLTCGHCGRHMIGRTYVKETERSTYTYRVYTCGGYNTYGKEFCHVNAIPEAALLRCVVSKVVNKLEHDFLNPENVRLLKEEIRRQEEETRSGGGQVQEDDLATKIEALDSQISRAAKRMLTEDDETLIPHIRKELQGLKQQHAQLSHRMARVREIAMPVVEDIDKAVERAAACVGQLREAMNSESPASLGSALRGIVGRIELWFTNETRGKSTRCRFAEGLIYLQEGASVAQAEAPLSAQASLPPFLSTMCRHNRLTNGSRLRH